jgi:hypothetical protein
MIDPRRIFQPDLFLSFQYRYAIASRDDKPITIIKKDAGRKEKEKADSEPLKTGISLYFLYRKRSNLFIPASIFLSNLFSANFINRQKLLKAITSLQRTYGLWKVLTAFIYAIVPGNDFKLRALS